MLPEFVRSGIRSFVWGGTTIVYRHEDGADAQHNATGDYDEIAKPRLQKLTGSPSIKGESRLLGFTLPKTHTVFPGGVVDYKPLYAIMKRNARVSEAARGVLPRCICTQRHGRGELRYLREVHHDSGVVFLLGTTCTEHVTGSKCDVEFTPGAYTLAFEKNVALDIVKCIQESVV